MPRRRPPPRALGCLTALALLVVALLVGELLARRSAVQLPAWQGIDDGNVVLTGHPSRLWGLSPGARRNGQVTATVNAQGLRGELPRLPPPAHRVLLLGDSTFFGHGVTDAQAMGAVLERSLSDTLDLQLINGAVPGYSSAQSLLLMQEQGWALDPTLLLVGSFWSDNSWDRHADAALLRSRALAQHNPLVRSALFRQGLAWLAPMLGPRRVVTWRAGQAQRGPAVRRVALEDYAANLDRLCAEASVRGVGVALLRPAGRADLVEGGEHPWLGYALAQEAVAKRWSAPLLPLQPLLEAPPTLSVDALLLDDLHPSAEGHRRIGEGLARELRGLGWPSEGLLPREAGALSLERAQEVEARWQERPESAHPRAPSAQLFR